MDTDQKEKTYWPLITLTSVAALATLALTYGLQRRFFDAMHFFMGLLFCQFAMLKLFHLRGFADGFQTYDLLAKKSRTYAYIYPCIELGLGLGYLSFIYPLFIYAFTVLVMLIGSIGVILALKKGLKVKCACMGTILNVPLSTVTLSEDIGMGLMALFMLFFA